MANTDPTPPPTATPNPPPTAIVQPTTGWLVVCDDDSHPACEALVHCDECCLHNQCAKCASLEHRATKTKGHRLIPIPEWVQSKKDEAMRQQQQHPPQDGPQQAPPQNPTPGPQQNPQLQQSQPGQPQPGQPGQPQPQPQQQPPYQGYPQPPPGFPPYPYTNQGYPPPPQGFPPQQSQMPYYPPGYPQDGAYPPQPQPQPGGSQYPQQPNQSQYPGGPQYPPPPGGPQYPPQPGGPQYPPQPGGPQFPPQPTGYPPQPGMYPPPPGSSAYPPTGASGYPPYPQTGYPPSSSYPPPPVTVVAPPGPAPTPANITAAMKPVFQNHSLNSLYVDPRIPSKKDANIRKHARVPFDEPIVAIIDCTVFGSADNGIAFTPHGIYVHNDWTTVTEHGGGHHFVDWRTVLKANNKALKTFEVHLGAEHSNVVNLSGSGVSEKQLLRILEELKPVLRPFFP